MNDKRIIVITRTRHGFEARLKDDPTTWGYGSTVFGAIGNLFFFYMSKFGVVVEMPRDIFEQMKTGAPNHECDNGCLGQNLTDKSAVASQAEG